MSYSRGYRPGMARWFLFGFGLLTWLAGDARCAPATGLIVVGADGKAFTERSTNRRFVPFGTNYYDPHTGWAPKIWRQFDPNRVAEHFRIMSGLGVNCARIFLTAATFQPDMNTVDEGALKKLDAMVGLPPLTEDEQARWIVAEIEATRRVATGWLSWSFADTPDSTDMSKFGGLVRSDLTPKPWAERFKAYASQLPTLPRPAPELPSLDPMPSLTMPADELPPLHEKYSSQVQSAITR